MIWKIIKCTHCLGTGDTRDPKCQIRGTVKSGVGKCVVCNGKGKLLTIRTNLNIIVNSKIKVNL